MFFRPYQFFPRSILGFPNNFQYHHLLLQAKHFHSKDQEFPMSYLHILLILILNKIILKYQDMNMREMTQNQIQALKDLNLLMLKL